MLPKSKEIIMKLHLTQADGQNLMTGYSAQWISVNHQRIEHSLIVTPDTLITDWKIEGFDQLSEADFEKIAHLKPEVVLLGTGQTHRFIHPSLIKPLTEANIAVECMTTDAACRTYNILMAEGRQVAAALII
jgi:uncharacterized protein